MNTEELENKIWENASSWTSKTKLWKSIRPKCDKKTCFDYINRMIPTQLKKREVRNRIEVVRIDMTRRAEFEFALTWQKNYLKEKRDELNKYHKPMFYLWNTIVHYIPPVTKANIKEFRKAYKKNMKNPKGFKFDEAIKIWKTRKPNVITTLEDMKFYYTGILIFISRCLLQKSLGIISTKEANIRIKKCEKVLEDHFRIIFKQNNLNDQEAIKQFHEHGHGLTGSIYNIGQFRI